MFMFFAGDGSDLEDGDGEDHTEEEDDQDDSEDDDSDDSNDDDDDSSDDDDNFHKKELERVEAELVEEKERRIKAEKAIQKGKKKAQEDETDDDDKPLTRREAQELIDESKNADSEEQVEEEIEEVASNPDEAKLIRHHLKNTIKRTGNVKKDVRRARLHANEGNLEALYDEVDRGEESRDGKSAGDVSSQHRKQGRQYQEPQVSERNRQMLDTIGVAWDPSKGEFTNSKGVRVVSESGTWEDLEVIKPEKE